MPRITLIGYRGTGKSTVAAIVSQALEMPWRDADLVLENKLGCSIAQLIRDRGEDVFRDEESAVLVELLAECNSVLATGGGVVLRKCNRDMLSRQGRPTVWLNASAPVVRNRLSLDPTTSQRRPALSGVDPLAEVTQALLDRAPLYHECADFVVDTAESSAQQVADEIVAWLTTQWPAMVANSLRDVTP